MKTILIGFLCGLPFYSCQFKEKEKVILNSQSQLPLSKALTGEWRNTTLNVKMNSAGGQSDSIATLVVNKGEWDSIMQIKPIRTHFLPASNGPFRGGYYSDYLALDGSFIVRKTGSWEVKEDSLIMEENNIPYKYYVEFLADGEVAFTSVMDWDQDGASDDEYYGTQKKY